MKHGMGSSDPSMSAEMDLGPFLRQEGRQPVRGRAAEMAPPARFSALNRRLPRRPKATTLRGWVARVMHRMSLDF